MVNPVQAHYQNYPYPHYPLFASVRRCDTYALNLHALWGRFNHALPPAEAKNILIAGCGTFAPYPWSVANPEVPITALDLSGRSLRRARMHCLLHGRRNIVYRCGDLSDQAAVDGAFGLIDAYGVLHHLPDPLEGLQALACRLVPGGILRIMVYSRYARREEESIRRAFRLLNIDSPGLALKMLRRAAPESRLASYRDASDEATTRSGLADALLHPSVRSYRIDELLEMVAQAGLELRMFAHHGACENPVEEVERLRGMELERRSPGNFVAYLGKRVPAPAPEHGDSMIMLNPCLESAVSRFTLGTLTIPARIGIENPGLTYRDRSFLRRFATPVNSRDLSPDDAIRVAVYKRCLFLVDYQT
ncbi:MAG: SAM-dependent methyltransferase [Geobacteraceae bacterium GWC2_53_11]|nr:MAG: SAM-dependent methyltransferase [Geobacteraceae bacterium GWC2_53_11]